MTRMRRPLELDPVHKRRLTLSMTLERSSESIALPTTRSTRFNIQADSSYRAASIFQATANVSHGIQFNGGQPSPLDLPGCSNTSIQGVNDRGDVVGICNAGSSSAGSFKYTPATGALVPVAARGAVFTSVSAINNAGQIVGSYLDASNKFHGFLLSGGNSTTIDPQGSVFTALFGINNEGQIVGEYEDSQTASQGVSHGLLAAGPQLVDPVPDVLAGPSVANNTLLQSLGLFGRVVDGVAADGVTQVLVRIPANHVGDQFTITLLNDAQQVSVSPDADGALSNPGNTGLTQAKLTVTAIGVTAP